MRENIYYWKCDRFGQNRFDNRFDPELCVEAARRAVQTAFGQECEWIEFLGGNGNHGVCKVRCAGRDYLFRANADGSGDDYMLAEAALTRLAAAAGVPVPALAAVEVTGAVRWQLWSWAEGRNLAELDREGLLDRNAVARQLGGILRRLHRVELAGFGFVDTQHLAAAGEVRGLNPRYRDYFHTRLDDQLAGLVRTELIDIAFAAAIKRCFERHAALLELPGGRLVHRDPAWWNLLGGPADIIALIDWDDAVSGDPADDFGLLCCFHDGAIVEAALAGYGPVEESFRPRMRLHYLRNMIWKALLRQNMGYFEKGREFFLNAGTNLPLRELTLHKLKEAFESL